MLFIQLNGCNMELNLHRDFVRNYWKTNNEQFYQVLSLIAPSETWTLSDDINFQSKLEELCQLLEGQSTQYLSQNFDEIIELMQYMDIFQFSYFLHRLDKLHVGISFHYVMEARYHDTIQHFLIFYQRLSYIKNCNCLVYLIEPMRNRLISGLLVEHKEDEKNS